MMATTIMSSTRVKARRDERAKEFMKASSVADLAGGVLVDALRNARATGPFRAKRA